MQKIRKILGAVSEKTALPTNQPTNQQSNQPTNYYQQHRPHRTSLTPVQKIYIEQVFISLMLSLPMNQPLASVYFSNNKHL